MISKSYEVICSEDPSFIENYDKAIADPYIKWVIHHRLEIDLNVSAKYLKDNDLYYNRPASELIYLTPDAHAKLHTPQRISAIKSAYEKRKKQVVKKKITEITDEMLENMLF